MLAGETTGGVGFVASCCLDRRIWFFVREIIFVWFVSRGFSGLFTMSSDDA
jgi:hypothetical protein